MLDDFINFMITIVQNGGIVVAILLCVIEAILPFLPLSVFIALNFSAFGYLGGFIVSYIGVIIGSMLSYLIFKKIGKKSKKYTFLSGILEKVEKIKKMKITTFTVLSSFPFSPSFLFNVLGGVSNMPVYKFLISRMISKLFIVFFWGIVGKGFIDNRNDLSYIVILVLITLFSFILSKISEKMFNIE